KEFEYGILICGTGIGISIAANRFFHDENIFSINYFLYDF
ncbi:RpiB/LacA/LacB family sugar-phosphate isomerase, partial [Clostridium perfringens]